LLLLFFFFFFFFFFSIFSFWPSTSRPHGLRPHDLWPSTSRPLTFDLTTSGLRPHDTIGGSGGPEADMDGSGDDDDEGAFEGRG
jgi:hypothetical protein